MRQLIPQASDSHIWLVLLTVVGGLTALYIMLWGFFTALDPSLTISQRVVWFVVCMVIGSIGTSSAAYSLIVNKGFENWYSDPSYINKLISIIPILYGLLIGFVFILAYIVLRIAIAAMMDEL